MFSEPEQIIFALSVSLFLVAFLVVVYLMAFRKSGPPIDWDRVRNTAPYHMTESRKIIENALGDNIKKISTSLGIYPEDRYFTVVLQDNTVLKFDQHGHELYPTSSNGDHL